MRTGVKATKGPLVRLPQRTGGHFDLETLQGSPKGMEQGGGERGAYEQGSAVGSSATKTNSGPPSLGKTPRTESQVQ